MRFSQLNYRLDQADAVQAVDGLKIECGRLRALLALQGVTLAEPKLTEDVLQDLAALEAHKDALWAGINPDTPATPAASPQVAAVMPLQPSEICLLKFDEKV